MSDQGNSGDNSAEQRSSKEAFSALDRDLGGKRRFKLPHFKFPWGLVKIVAAAVILLPIAAAGVYRVIDPPGTILMLQRWLGGADIRHQNVKYSDISPHIIRAVLAAEDARFCEHKGFDVEAIQAAYASNAAGKGVMRGGSTISQQTAKNLFLWPQRDFVRKGLETYSTFLIEHLYPKERIMQNYLNVAEWGPGVFGIQAAAQSKFKVSAGQVTPRQAALLAAILPSPLKWSATNPGPYVRRRAATIEARMYAISAQGLDRCVVDPKAAKPPRPRGRVPTTLEPLPALPPDVALEAEAPMIVPAEGVATPAEIDPMMTSTFNDGEAEPEAAPDAAPPADAPPVEAAPTPSAAP